MSSAVRLPLIAALLAPTIGCARGVDVVPARAPRAPPSATMTLMTFNVHQDESHDPSTVAAVGAPHADIVCLQETTADWERALRARYSDQYPYMLFRTRENAGGMAVLSRWPIGRAELLAISDWHPAVLATIATPAGPLELLNVHLRARFDGDDDPLTNFFGTGGDHLFEMKAFAEEMKGGAPVVVLGDFNESPEGPALAWLERRGFENALPRFHPGQHTWRGRSILAGVTMSLDYVLYSAPLRPVDAWIPPRGRSDHLPVVVRFDLSNLARPSSPAPSRL